MCIQEVYKKQIGRWHGVAFKISFNEEPLPTGASLSGMVGSWVHMGSLSQLDCQIARYYAESNKSVAKSVHGKGLNLPIFLGSDSAMAIWTSCTTGAWTGAMGIPDDANPLNRCLPAEVVTRTGWET